VTRRSRSACAPYLWLSSIVLSGGITAADATSPVDVWNIDSGLVLDGAYFGETVANGMIGIQVMPEPFPDAANHTVRLI
jgi:hypothetical protein